jgi:RNA polymerase sigma-70 factor (ECF subfamily)
MNPDGIKDIQHDDVELARQAIAGDEAAWRTIYDETSGPLFNFLCYQTGDREMAVELMQETYVTALEKLDTFSGAGSLAGWLRSIALRKSLDWRRRVALRIRKLTALARENSSLSRTQSEDRFPGLGDGFQRTLDRLSAKQRAALLLRELEDLSFSQIAESIGCSEPTARVHYHRACRNMRRWLTEGDDLVFSADAGGMS